MGPLRTAAIVCVVAVACLQYSTACRPLRTQRLLTRTGLVKSHILAWSAAGVSHYNHVTTCRYSSRAVLRFHQSAVNGPWSRVVVSCRRVLSFSVSLACHHQSAVMYAKRSGGSHTNKSSSSNRARGSQGGSNRCPSVQYSSVAKRGEFPHELHASANSNHATTPYSRALQ